MSNVCEVIRLVLNSTVAVPALPGSGCSQPGLWRPHASQQLMALIHFLWHKVCFEL